MGETTGIEWTDATWTPVRARYVDFDRSPDNPGGGVLRVGWHCEHVSEGCRNCYAETMNKRLGTGKAFKPGELAHKNRHGEDVFGATLFLDERLLLAPLKWRKPKRIFVCSMTDLFADFVPDAVIDRMFAVMALCPQHSFQVLTKRPELMRDYFREDEGFGRWGFIESEARKIVREYFPQRAAELNGKTLAIYGGENLPNVWLGVSVEDQAAADERIPLLLDTPAAVRFLSCEPLLGAVDLTSIDLPGGWNEVFPLGQECLGRPHVDDSGNPMTRIDWVIAGGESGPGARPMHPDWARGLRDQCAAAGVPFLHKQNGEYAPGEIAGEYLNPERSAKGLSLFDGKWIECWSEPEGHCDDEPDVYRVGKKRAGRLLDGVQHDGMPA